MGRLLATLTFNLFLMGSIVTAQGGLIDLSLLNSGGNHHPDVSADGRFIVFQSSARPGGAGREDIYLFDRSTNALVPLPGLNSRFPDWAPSISGDGRFIAFNSDRPDGSGGPDIYLYDRQAGTLVPLPDLNTGYPDMFPAISGDGRFIAYNFRTTIRLYDRQRAALIPLPSLASRDNHTFMGFSANARFITFFRETPSMVNPVYLGDYLYDRETSLLTRLPDDFRATDISPDGRFLLLQMGGDIQLYDRSAGTTIDLPGLNSKTMENGAKMSPDTRFIAFNSFRTGVTSPGIFLYDRGAR